MFANTPLNFNGVRYQCSVFCKTPDLFIGIKAHNAVQWTCYFAQRCIRDLRLDLGRF